MNEVGPEQFEVEASSFEDLLDDLLSITFRHVGEGSAWVNDHRSRCCKRPLLFSNSDSGQSEHPVHLIFSSQPDDVVGIVGIACVIGSEGVETTIRVVCVVDREDRTWYGWCVVQTIIEEWAWVVVATLIAECVGSWESHYASRRTDSRPRGDGHVLKAADSEGFCIVEVELVIHVLSSCTGGAILLSHRARTRNAGIWWCIVPEWPSAGRAGSGLEDQPTWTGVECNVHCSLLRPTVHPHHILRIGWCSVDGVVGCA